MSPWGWKPERSEGIWRHGLPCLRPLVSAAPWLTLVLLLVLFWFVGGTLVSAKGVLFDLPESDTWDGEATDMVALIVPMDRGTLVFFDDSRYQLGDAASELSLKAHLKERTGSAERRTLLTLADRRVSGGELMRFADIARAGGVRKLLFAERKTEAFE